MNGQRRIRVGELFAGIGGIARGLEATGHYETAWFAEIDPYCQAILRKHWPDTPIYGDVRQMDWSKVAPVDMLAFGFPCQPSSTAGRRKGTADERWLWPEAARAVGVLRPQLVLVENVPGLLTVNDGEAFAEVVGSLAQLGYDSEWSIVSAASTGAPHLRKRVFLIAWRKQPSDVANSDRRGGRSEGGNTLDEGRQAGHDRPQGVPADGERERRLAVGDARPANPDAFNSDSAGLAGESGSSEAEPNSHGPKNRLPEQNHPDAPQHVVFTWPPKRSGFWRRTQRRPIAEIAAALCRVDDGLPERLHQAHRKSRLQALGNAVVPAVAAHVGQLIWERLSALQVARGEIEMC